MDCAVSEQRQRGSRQSLLAIGQDNLGALVEQQVRGGKADARCPARDQSDLALNATHAMPPIQYAASG